MRSTGMLRMVWPGACMLVCWAVTSGIAMANPDPVEPSGGARLNRGVAMYGLGNPKVARKVAEHMRRIPVELTRTYLDLRQVWADPHAPDWADMDARLGAIEQFGCEVLIHTQYVPRWLSQAPELTQSIRSGANRVPASMPCSARFRRMIPTVSAKSVPRWYTRFRCSATCLSARLIASMPSKYSRATSSAVSASA